MGDIQLYIVHAFAEKNGGNVAGVVLNAGDLSNDQKQEIARQVNLSETAFVSNSDKADYKIDFFTPTKQIPDCGHATIAAYFLLNHMGKIKKRETSKETIGGVRKISLKNSYVFMELSRPHFLNVATNAAENISISEIIDSLGNGFNEGGLDGQLVIVKAEVAFLIIPLRNQSLLRQVRPNFNKISAVSNRLGLVGYYLFSKSDVNANSDVTTRMFAPSYGINEESATGMAAGNLAAYLHAIAGSPKTSFLVEQGTAMEPSSPSFIHTCLKVNDGTIEKIIVGGTAYISETKSFPTLFR